MCSYNLANDKLLYIYMLQGNVKRIYHVYINCHMYISCILPQKQATGHRRNPHISYILVNPTFSPHKNGTGIHNTSKNSSQAWGSGLSGTVFGETGLEGSTGVETRN